MRLTGEHKEKIGLFGVPFDTTRKRTLAIWPRICRMPEDQLLTTPMLGMVEGS